MSIRNTYVNRPSAKLYLFFFLLLLIIPLFTNMVSVQAHGSLPTIQFDQVDQLVKLDGDWLFMEEELIEYEQLSVFANFGELVQVPLDFQSHTGKKHNYGSFLVNVTIPEQLIGKSLSIHIPYQYSAYRLFVDERLVAKNGKVGRDEQSHESEMAPKTATFTPEKSTFSLIMQVSSFEHIRGGFENSIVIGQTEIISRDVHAKMIAGAFVNGIVLIIGLFMILFALFRRIEQLFFIFGLFALFVSIRGFFTVPFHYTIIFPSISWLWGTRIEYFLTTGASMFYVMLMWKWHEEEFSKKLMYALVAIHLFVMTVTLFTQPYTFQSLFFTVFYLAIPVFIYFIYIVIKSIRNNNVSAKVNLFGITIIFIAFLNDFFIGQGYYSAWNLMLPVVVLYIMIHVVSMSEQFAQFVFQIERQNIELKKLNQSNENLTEKLQNEIKRKDEFLANTSHELRNPLHSMINIAHSILINRSNELDEELKDDISLQVTIGHHMARTLDDLLDITRLKEQRVSLQKSSFHFRSVLQAVIDMLMVLIDRENVEIVLEVDEDLPEMVADQNRIIQILFNLIHNALKFTYEGKVTIRAYEAKQAIIVEIEDTGIGMEEDFLHRLFLPYEQGDSAIGEANGGLGLGLSICKELIELHGGSIAAESTIGEGSCFRFSIPLVDSAPAQAAVTELTLDDVLEQDDYPRPSSIYKVMDQVADSRPSLHKAKVLIVDDDLVNLRVISSILSNLEYDIQTASCAEEALQLTNQTDIDLLISDVMMPSMSGYELTKRIRETHSISELPIILLTARNKSDDIYTGFLVGANDYLLKPVDAMELIMRVKALTDLQASIKERLKMEAAWLHAQIRPHFLLNTLNSIVSLSQFDTERMVKLIEQFSYYMRSSFQFKNLDKKILLEDELDLVRSYLYIQTERFGNRLKIVYEIEEVSDVMIPPLTIQTLVENAVNHGVLQRVEGGTVTIRVHRLEEGLEIAVQDDGVGMDEKTINELFSTSSSREGGIGLINTEQRLQRLYQAGLRIESELNVGSTVSFIIPYRHID